MKAKKKIAQDWVRLEPQLLIPAKAKPKVLTALTAIRNLFGPKGQYWTTGTEHEVVTEDKNGKELAKAIDKFCLVGSAKEVNGEYEGAARAAIALAILERTKQNIADGIDDDEETITSYNDSKKWADVKAVLARAKQLVQQA